MPNTLAHLGIQALVTRSLIREAEIKWIWAACVIPDLPWILQRFVRTAVPDVSPYDLRLYVIVQASLLMCLLLSVSVACLSTRPLRVFAILALGCTLHLLLDATQTKWANGVHLFAPVSWVLTNFGLYWPEEWPSLALTALGLAYAVHAWFQLPDGTDDLHRPTTPRLAVMAVFGFAYVAMPFALVSGVRAADNHYVATLQDIENRSGHEVAFDRNLIVINTDGAQIIGWTGEKLTAIGNLPNESAKISLRGHFKDATTVFVSAHHRHEGRLRDLAAYIGLTLVFAWWVRCLTRSKN